MQARANLIFIDMKNPLQKLLILIIIPCFLACTSKHRPLVKTPLLPIKQYSKWGYINAEMKMVIKPIFDGAKNFSEGMAPVKTKGKWGYINGMGIFIIKPAFDSAEIFKGGYALVKFENKYFWIDRNGNAKVKTGTKKKKSWEEKVGDDIYPNWAWPSVYPRFSGENPPNF